MTPSAHPIRHAHHHDAAHLLIVGRRVATRTGSCQLGQRCLPGNMVLFHRREGALADAQRLDLAHHDQCRSFFSDFSTSASYIVHNGGCAACARNAGAATGVPAKTGTAVPSVNSEECTRAVSTGDLLFEPLSESGGGSCCSWHAIIQSDK